MAIVENNVVKMEWDKGEWLQTKAGTFIFAGKTYEGSKGEVSVLFHPDAAYLWVSDYKGDEQELWSSAEVKAWFKSDKPDGFPFEFDEMVEVIASGESVCIDSVLEEFGIEAFKEDIEKRLQDIKPYGEEFDVQL